jgi:hypothetical protein
MLLRIAGWWDGWRGTSRAPPRKASGADQMEKPHKGHEPIMRGTINLLMRDITDHLTASSLRGPTAVAPREREPIRWMLHSPKKRYSPHKSLFLYGQPIVAQQSLDQ